MNKLVLALKSRTNWTIVVMYLIEFGPKISELVPTQWKPLVLAALGLVAFYFKVNPSQDYTQ